MDVLALTLRRILCCRRVNKQNCNQISRWAEHTNPHLPCQTKSNQLQSVRHARLPIPAPKPSTQSRLDDRLRLIISSSKLGLNKKTSMIRFLIKNATPDSNANSDESDSDQSLGTFHFGVSHHQIFT